MNESCLMLHGKGNHHFSATSGRNLIISYMLTRGWSEIDSETSMFPIRPALSVTSSSAPIKRLFGTPVFGNFRVPPGCTSFVMKPESSKLLQKFLLFQGEPIPQEIQGLEHPRPSPENAKCPQTH